MRKLFLVITILLCGKLSFGQAVADQAVVPVSVTLNSILRLTVTSGGNIVFVFNTIAQYTGGIAATPRTTTQFKVSSSRNYKVTLATETPTFVGIETGNTTFLLNNVGYLPTTVGGALVAAGRRVLVASEDITLVTGVPAGGNHTYSLAWEVGTVTAPLVGSSLATLSLATDIYVNNIYLTLAPF